MGRHSGGWYWPENEWGMVILAPQGMGKARQRFDCTSTLNSGVDESACAYVFFVYLHLRLLISTLWWERGGPDSWAQEHRGPFA